MSIFKNRLQLISLASLFLIFSLSFKPNFLSQISFLKGDSLSYLAHSMTIALDLDINYENEIIMGAAHEIPSHPIGAGLMAAPFVGLFYQLDKLSDHSIIIDRSKYKSSWTLVGYIFSGIFYFFFGVFLYLLLIKKLFPDSSKFLLLLAVTSSGIIYFVLNVPFLAHSFEFFSLALLSYVSFRSIEERTFFWIAMVLFSVVLALLVRYNNLSAVLLPLIIACFLALLFPIRFSQNELMRQLKAFSLVGVTGFLLFCLALFILYDVAYPSISGIYGSEGAMSMNVLTGREILSEIFSNLFNIPKLFFGWEFGLVFSNPTLVVSLFGLLMILVRDIYRKDKRAISFILLFLCLISYGLSLGIVLWWKSTASTYGYRYLLTLMPLCLLGTYFVVSKLRSSFPSILKKFLTTAFLFILLFSSFSQFFADTTEGLMYVKGINSYGIERDFTYPDYSKNFLFEFFKPQTWFIALSKGPLGLLIAPIVVDTWLANLFDQSLWQQYRAHYGHLTILDFCQLLFLFFAWIFLGQWVAVKVVS